MHFLKEIDEKKAEYIVKNNILNEKEYYYYIKLEFEDEDEKLLSKDFYFLKVNTLSIIMKDRNSKIKIYLSDYDIINILIFLSKKHLEIAKNIFEQMESLIKEAGNETSFYIESNKYDIKGINLENNLNFDIDTPMDISINIYDFITLLNLVIEKERYANHVQGTLCKYIAVSKYYADILSTTERKKVKTLLGSYNINTNVDIEYNSKIINKDKDHKLLIEYQELLSCFANKDS
ncbi:hypothetical protein [Cellulosilyticum sp. I15G10I2]|uniref:hypothetical protein n=1 Tax=Cellulosilyticum sp. I15G10I2 TaxID=1892843 RepID=UPI00085CC66F|nr:hypothetical protein [Cellulosilyticum sp. I15G10I2]